MIRQGFRLALLAAAAALVPACGSSGGGAPASPTPSLAPASHDFVDLQAAGARSVQTGGGAGSTGKGGNGGSVQFHSQSASDLWVLRSGSVDASFVLPSETPYLGANPRTISVDTTLSVGAGLSAGSTAILGDDGVSTATALWVKPGVTLTLDPNIDTNGSPGTYEQAALGFFWTVFIEGTVRTGLRTGTLDRAHLYFSGANFVARPGAVIDLAGDAAAPGNDGHQGGSLYVTMTSGVVNEASVTSTGGSGDNGGDGGSIEMYSGGYSVQNTADLNSSGGAGNAGKGGHAGFIWLTSSYNPSAYYIAGGTFNRGNLTARGGDGTLGGGDGNIILSVYHNSAGPFVSSGTIDASGGDATVDGNGGNAGGTITDGVIGTPVAGMWLVGEGGHCRITGTLRARGGAGAGSGNGGNGNRIEVSSNSNAIQPVNGGCYVSADIDTRGGAGAVGGNGGDFVLWNNSDWQVNAARLDDSPTYFVGCASIDTRGAAGQTDGGNGGLVLLVNNPAYDFGGDAFIGNVLNEPDLSTGGGLGTTGLGGNGGNTYIGTGPSIMDFSAGANQQVTPKYDRRVVNKGAVASRGGNGATTGGTGGRFNLADYYRIENFGAVDGSGGNGGSGNAGRAGGFIFQTDGVLVNQADLRADGGDSTAGNGGDGTDEGGFWVSTSTLDGRTTIHSGNISARGGTSTGGLSGRGGVIVVSSWDPWTPSTIGGTLSVPGGGGPTPGKVGQVRIDGIDADLVGGSVTR